MKDILAVTLTVIVILAFLSIPLSVIYLGEKYLYCPAYGRATGLDTRYSFLGGGCFVHAKTGEWVIDSNYYNSVAK